VSSLSLAIHTISSLDSISITCISVHVGPREWLHICEQYSPIFWQLQALSHPAFTRYRFKQAFWGHRETHPNISFFHDFTIRKTNKSAPGLLLKSKIESMSSPPETSRFIVDGGYLLRAWTVKSTYDVACEAYVSYTLKHFGFDILVVFDESVTKEAEQKVKHLGHHQGYLVW